MRPEKQGHTIDWALPGIESVQGYTTVGEYQPDVIVFN